MGYTDSWFDLGSQTIVNGRPKGTGRPRAAGEKSPSSRPEIPSDRAVNAPRSDRYRLAMLRSASHRVPCLGGSVPGTGLRKVTG